MPAKYEVVEQTYVPVGSGFKYKRPGQIVTLKAADARKLGDLVRKVDDDEGVAERNTSKSRPESKPKSKPDEADDKSEDDSSSAAVLETETVRVVTPDGSESTSADERAGDEAPR
jgi:hypothetical protein